MPEVPENVSTGDGGLRFFEALNLNMGHSFHGPITVSFHSIQMLCRLKRPTGWPFSLFKYFIPSK